MLRQLIKLDKKASLRKLHFKPPVILRQPESYFQRPKQMFRNSVPDLIKESDPVIKNLSKRVNTHFRIKRKKSAIREQEIEESKKIDFYNEIKAKLELDEESGMYKNIGYDKEIELFKLRQGLSHSEGSFLASFDEMVETFNCMDIFEFLEFYKHSVALRLSGEKEGAAMGALLKKAAEERMGRLGEGEDVEEFTQKIAMKILYSKIEGIIESRKENTTRRFNRVLDFLMNDPLIRPGRIVTQELMDRIYHLSNIRLKEKEGEKEDDLYMNYFERKMAIMSEFADLPMEKKVTLKVDADFRVNFLQGILDKETGETADTRERGEITLKLKDILGYNQIVEGLDNQIEKLERQLDLSKKQLDRLPLIKSQLQLLLHTMPKEMREKFDLDSLDANSGNFNYLDKNFVSDNLQWRNVDLSIPAEILPVEEYKETLRAKKRDAQLRELYPDYKLNDSPQYSLNEEWKRRNYYGDEPEQDPSKTGVNIDFVVDNDQLIAGDEVVDRAREQMDHNMNDLFKEKEEGDEKTDSEEDPYLSTDEEEHTNKRETGWTLLEPPIKERKNKEYKKNTEYLDEVILSRRKDLSNKEKQIIREKMSQKKKISNLFGKNLFVPVNRLHSFDYDAESRSFKMELEDMNDRQITDNMNYLNNELIESGETEEFFEDISDKYKSHEIEQAVAMKKNITDFDYLMQTDNLKNPEVVNLDETFTRAIDFYKEINASLYHKHYLAKLFKMRQMDNPLQLTEMLDAEDDPNYGLLRDKAIEDLKGDDRIDRVPKQQKETEKKIIDRTNIYHWNEDISGLGDLNPKYFGIGYRKRCRALAIVEPNGTGVVTVNERSIIDYFTHSKDRNYALTSVFATGLACKVNLRIFVSGGGRSGQADAVLVAVSNALIKAFPESEQFIKERYFNYIDPRTTERKKVGQYKARKSYTYVRR